MALMPIERGKIREYAVATENGRPEYLDDPRASVPPTFLATVVFWEQLTEAVRSPRAERAFTELGIRPDVRRLLSAEQEYLFHGPPPRAGDQLLTSLRFDRVSEKSGRHGRMLFVYFTVEFHDATGALRAECRYTSAYLTGDGGVTGRSTRAPSGGTGPARSGAVRGALPERWFGPVTLTDIVRYQGASGDLNPMHHDDDLARSAGYPEAFSVGMLGAGYLATYCTDRYAPDSVRRFRSRFRELVWRGDRLLATGRVADERTVNGERRDVLELRLTTDTGAVAVEGTAEFASG
ncbi:MaoC family dehydratase N-terminal domain-containing protein [Streptomyces sp. NPDC088746]|uniref:FAS1-like dehydratase domain-containing protein n=1 Tax=Streptomyces sp. NPDC088746 TaxID=3365885 RepID=UPI00381E6CD0